MKKSSLRFFSSPPLRRWIQFLRAIDQLHRDSDPSGVTVVQAQAVTSLTPTRITSNAAATSALTSTYLAPMLAALNISTPSGYVPGGFTFHQNADGTSVATVTWVKAPGN